MDTIDDMMYTTSVTVDGCTQTIETMNQIINSLKPYQKARVMLHGERMVVSKHTGFYFAETRNDSCISNDRYKFLDCISIFKDTGYFKTYD